MSVNKTTNQSVLNFYQQQIFSEGNLRELKGRLLILPEGVRRHIEMLVNLYFGAKSSLSVREYFEIDPSDFSRLQELLAEVTPKILCIMVEGVESGNIDLIALDKSWHELAGLMLVYKDALPAELISWKSLVDLESYRWRESDKYVKAATSGAANLLAKKAMSGVPALFGRKAPILKTINDVAVRFADYYHLKRGVGDFLLEQTLDDIEEVLWGIVDHTGAVSIKDVGKLGFSEFRKFLIEQAELNDNMSFRTPYASLLKEPRFGPLFEVLYGRASGKAVSYILFTDLRDLARDFISEMIDIDEDAIVERSINSESGRRRLAGIILDDKYKLQIRSDLIKAVGRVSKAYVSTERIEGISDYISTINYFNWAETGHNVAKAGTAALGILEEIGIQATGYKAEGKPKSAKLKDQIEGNLAELEELARAESYWSSIDKGIRSSLRGYVEKSARELRESLGKVKSEEEFDKYLEKLRKFLNQRLNFLVEGSGFRLLMDKSGGSRIDRDLARGLSSIMSGISPSYRKSLDRLIYVADIVYHAKGMGEAVIDNREPKARDKDLSAMISNLAGALDETRFALWYKYKSHGALSRLIANAEEARSMGDIVEIRRACLALRLIKGKLMGAESSEDINKAISILIRELRENRVIYNGLESAEVDGIEASINLLQTTLEIVVLSMALKGSGIGAGAAGAGAETVSWVTRSLRGFGLGAYSSTMENIVGRATDQAGITSTTFEDWLKDAVATGLSMAITGLLPATAGGGRNLIENVWRRYTVNGSRSAFTFLRDTGVEISEEMIDQYVREAFNGNYDVMTLNQVLETVLVCLAGGGLKVGAVAEAIAGDRRGIVDKSGGQGEGEVRHPDETSHPRAGGDLVHPDATATPTAAVQTTAVTPPGTDLSYGVTEADKIANAMARVETDPKFVAEHIGDFGITNQTAPVAIATAIASKDSKAISKHIKQFGIIKETDRIKIAKIAAVQNGRGTSARIQDYGIKDQAELVAIAKISVAQSGGGTSAFIQNYGITAKAPRLEIAQIAFRSSPDIKTLKPIVSNYDLDLPRISFGEEFGIEDVESWAKEALRMRGLDESMADSLYADMKRRDAGISLLFELLVQLEKDESGLKAVATKGNKQLSRYLLSKMAGFDVNLNDGVRYSEKALGDLYELCTELQLKGVAGGELGLHLGVELFNDRRLQKVLWLLNSIIRVKGILGSDVETEIAGIFAEIGGAQGPQITASAENVGDIIVSTDDVFLKLFRERFKIEGRQVIMGEIEALEREWGDLKVFYTLVARFSGNSGWRQEVPVIGRIARTVLDRKFHRYKYEGFEGDAEDIKKAKAQLAALGSDDAVAGWKANYSKVEVYDPVGRSEGANQETLLARSKDMLTQQVKGHVEDALSGKGEVDQVKVDDIKAEIRGDPKTPTVLRFKKNRGALVRALFDLLEEAGTFGEYQKIVKLIGANDGAMGLSGQLKEDVKTLDDLLQYKESSSEGIIFTTTTDDPKLLLMTGDLVDTSSCQNYRTGTHIGTLPGYVIDADVKLLLTYLVRENDFVSAAEYKRAKALVASGAVPTFIAAKQVLKIGDIEFSLPRAYRRHVVKLGKTEKGSAGLALERGYIQNHPAEGAMEEQAMDVFETLANASGASTGVEITASGSRNPGGVYSDASGGSKKDEYKMKGVEKPRKPKSDDPPPSPPPPPVAPSDPTPPAEARHPSERQ